MVAGRKVVRKGFFPRGGGEVNIFVEPVNYIKPIKLVNLGKVCQFKIMLKNNVMNISHPEI